MIICIYTYLLTFFYSQNYMQVPPLKSMPISSNKILLMPEDPLMPQIKNLYQIFFNQKGFLIDFQKILPFPPRKEVNYICGTQITRKQISYRCYDCLIHQASLICQSCFHAGKHHNHRYSQIKEEGCCDCGDEKFLKHTGFCNNHYWRPKLQIQPPTQKQIMFKVYIRQIFIWIIKIWNKIDKNMGLIFAYQFIKYLKVLNSNSPYYNHMTADNLLDQKTNIMFEIIQMTFTYSIYKQQLIKIVFDFILTMTQYPKFTQRFLPIYIRIYNITVSFQTSKFTHLLPVLLNDSAAIKNAMSKQNQTLNPSKRKYNACKYYEHLLILKFLQPEYAQIFLAPLLKIDVIHSPYLQRIEQTCQQNNDTSFLTTITQNMQEQNYYYRLLSYIIGVVNNKLLLAQMIKNYCTKMMRCKFIKNKIVLMPQRIITLLIFKYFDFNVQKINLSQLRNILAQEQAYFDKFIYRYAAQTIYCLGQFGLDLARSTYFFNYRGIYIKQQSQVVMIDYLALKILSYIFQQHNRISSLSQFIFQIYQKQKQIVEGKSNQTILDYYNKWNKFIQILVQIVYSPKINIINSIFIKQINKVQTSAKQLLAQIAKKIGKISQEELKIIKKNIFFNQKIDHIISQVLYFNKKNKKYSISQQSIYYNFQQFNFDLTISLTHTELQTFIKNTKLKQIKISESAIDLRQGLLHPSWINNMLLKQLQFAKNLDIEHISSHMIQLVRVTDIVSLLYERKQQSINNLLSAYLNAIKQKIKNNQSIQNGRIAIIYKNLYNEVQKFMVDINQEQKQDEKNKQLQRRKNLSKLKKQMLLKERKIIENQQYFISKNQKQYQHNSDYQQEQECLICKQKSKKNKLCYLSKVRYNNILVKLLNKTSKHLIFYSCYHMVHFNCFKVQIQNKASVSCPLCSSAANIVLPFQQTTGSNLPQIQQHLHSILNNSLKYQSTNQCMQIVLFITYEILLNLDNKQDLSQKQIKICKSLNQILSYSYQKQPLKVCSLKDYPLKSQNKQHYIQQIVKCANIVKKLLDSPNIKRNQYIDQQYAYIQHVEQICKSLKLFLKQSASYKIVRNVLLIVQPTAVCKFIYKNPQEQITNFEIFNFMKVPHNINELLMLRDCAVCKKDLNHTNVICVLCGQHCCHDCGQVRKHTEKEHITESLYFRLATGGFIYDSSQIQLKIKSFFTNSIGKLWKPQEQSRQFYMDDLLFKQVCNAIKMGNLFYFLIHNFEGLQGKNLHDVI